MAKDKSGWSSFAKAALVVFGVITTLVVVVAVVATVWWKRHGKEFVDYAKSSYQQGQREGSKTDESGCLQAAAERAKTDTGVEHLMKNSIQMRICLSASRTNETFCQGVPDKNSIESSGWRKTKCAELGIQPVFNCGIVAVVQEYCYSDERSKKIAGNK